MRDWLPADYTDTYGCRVARGGDLTPEEVMVRLWSDFPWWVDAMFRLRDFLVKFVGLEGSGKDGMAALERCIRTGEPYRHLCVPARSEREVVLLLSDRHLDCWMSVYVEPAAEGERRLCVTTVVRFKNRLGRFYFFFVRPFHRLIARSLLRRAARNR